MKELKRVLLDNGASILPAFLFFSTRSFNHLNLGLETQETSPNCLHLSCCFPLNFIRANNL